MRLSLKVGAAASILVGAVWALHTPQNLNPIRRALSQAAPSEQSQDADSPSFSDFVGSLLPEQQNPVIPKPQLTREAETKLTNSVTALLEDVSKGRLELESEDDEFETLDLAQPDAVPIIVRLWSRNECDAATKWARALPESELKSASFRQIAIGVAAIAPETAEAWLQGLEAGPSRDAAIESIASEFASSDPQRALTLAEGMGECPARDQAIVHAISQWAATDPAAAAERARQFDDASMRANALAAIATAWADRDPSAAGRLAVEAILDPAAQARAVVSVVQRWAEVSPSDVATWVGKFSPGPIADNAVEQLVGLWARGGVDAPSNWLGTLTDLGQRDAGYATLARSIGLTDHTRALQFASLINDRSRRDATLLAIKDR